MRLILFLLLAATMAACTPIAQQAGRPDVTFQGPRLEDQAVVSFDGSRLGLTHWEVPSGEPWAVIIGLHGMNDYANAFHMAAPYWASQGIATYAYDQRGFGRSPHRRVWAGTELLAEDLRTVTALVRQKFPHAKIVVAGESLGGAVAVEAFASDRPPAADRVILLAPAVWGWSNLPLQYKTALWAAAHTVPKKVIKPPKFVTAHISASDNYEELVAMGRDPLMVWGDRTDSLYGLVNLMEQAWKKTGEIKAPVLYLYGAHDQVIPRRPSYQAAARLKPGDRTAYYANGWHLLLRDKQRQVVFTDIAAYIRDDQAPLPSGAPPIPGAPPAAPSLPTASAH